MIDLDDDERVAAPAPLGAEGADTSRDRPEADRHRRDSIRS